MRIASIETRNYRQYRKMVYNFDQTQNTDLHVAIAQNGIGKTNFLNSITWCLYGVEAHLNKKSNALPIINLKRLEEMNDGDLESVEVMIKITTSSSEFSIKRKETFRKTGDINKPIFPVSKSFEVDEIVNGKDYKIYREDLAKNKINQLFPENIKEYFFFDNEQLDRYFRDNSSESIKAAVYNISQISLLMSSKSRLEKEYKELKKQLSRAIPNLSSFQDALEIAELALKECETKISNYSIDISKGEERLRELREQLDGVEDISGAKSELFKKEVELASCVEAKRNIEQELNSFIRRNLMLLNMYPDLVKTRKVIEMQENEGNLPPKIDTDYITKLIESKKCFIDSCSLDDCKIEQLKKIIDSVSYSSEVSHLLVEVKSEVIRLIKEAEQYETKKFKLFNELDQVQEQMDELQNEIDKLKTSITISGDSSKIELLFKEKDSLLSKVEDSKRKKAREESDIEFLENKFIVAKDTYGKELKKQDKRNELYTKVTFVEKALNIMKDMENQIISEMKVSLKKEVYETFINLLWKENTFKDVIINDDFSIDLIHKHGYPCLGSCSAAETSLLALAFTLGLHKVSGFDAPIVIDTPVGRVSDVHRENFAEVLRKVSEHKQIIMFFTPSEYSEEVGNIFDKAYSTKQYIETEGEDESNIGG